MNFAALLRENRDRLDCDVVVVSDTGVFDWRDYPGVSRWGSFIEGIIFRSI